MGYSTLNAAFPDLKLGTRSHLNVIYQVAKINAIGDGEVSLRYHLKRRGWKQNYQFTPFLIKRMRRIFEDNEKKSLQLGNPHHPDNCDSISVK